MSWFQRLERLIFFGASSLCGFIAIILDNRYRFPVKISFDNIRRGIFLCFCYAVAALWKSIEQENNLVISVVKQDSKILLLRIRQIVWLLPLVSGKLCVSWHCLLS